MKDVVKLVAMVAMTVGLIDVVHAIKDKIDEPFPIVLLFCALAFFLVRYRDWET